MGNAAKTILCPPPKYKILTLGAHAQRGLQYLVSPSVRLSVYLSMLILALQATRRSIRDTSGFKATRA